MPLGAPLDLKGSILFSVSLTITQKGKFRFFLIYWMEHIRRKLSHLYSYFSAKIVLKYLKSDQKKSQFLLVKL